MKNVNASWVEAIAAKAGVGVTEVQAVLDKHRITASPVLPSPRRLKLQRIAFSGVKDGTEVDGPFEFAWDDLEHGLWALLSDRNLRGKSSVLEVVHWLLRGRPTSNLQQDIRRWIHKASVRFSLDDIVHEVDVDARGETRGTLIRMGRSGAKPSKLAEFGSDVDFESVMSDFFMKAFSMDALAAWQSSSTKEDELGHAVSHGWAAFSGAMFIGTNYEALLGDLPVAIGLNPRLIQMYLGVPWVTTFAASSAAYKAAQSAIDAAARKASRDAESKNERKSDLLAQLEAKEDELRSIPSDEEVRNNLGVLNAEYAQVKRREQTATRRLENDSQAISQARALYNSDRQELQTHHESVAAGAVFRLLDPTFCPRCDTAISEQKKKRENSTHSCSVCGEHTHTDEDALAVQAELDKRVKASKAALDAAETALGAAKDVSEQLRSSALDLQTRIEHETTKLGSYERQQELKRDIAVLQGRIDEVGFSSNSAPEGVVSEDLKILAAIVSETENRVKAVRGNLLNDVSERIVHYAQQFGMRNLTNATLGANATLALVKGRTNTSYSKVTPGEKLRLKVATILAMVEVGESNGVGRHPGLLMIDSPAAQEVYQGDLDALVSGLQKVSSDIVHFQVFVAGRTSDAITQHVPNSHRREALDGGFLW
ncbi:MAG: hypothetical protein PW792_04780 [Acidobacteriaceae bacterium]|nr:hypothetical protein [Acidobacteriaceae bacterium]